MKALSIRQPWAWLIVNGHKDIENRTWTTKQRGLVLVHASQGMTRQEYDDCMVCAIRTGLRSYFPRFEDLARGGIVGQVEIVDCVRESNSPWFFGPVGFLLRNAQPLPFQKTKGALGFFNASMPVESSGAKPC